MKMWVILVAVTLVAALTGCGVNPITEPEITNGTTVLLFPEWEHSESPFERKVYTNYYVVYSNGNWVTRERQSDGSLAQFWKSTDGDKTLDEAKQAFGLNIQWNVYKGIYDSMSK